jgi:GTP cyclohydrolase FolE2
VRNAAEKIDVLNNEGNIVVFCGIRILVSIHNHSAYAQICMELKDKQ